MQSKHDALLKRVDELDTECEQLRERVMDAEGEKDELQGVVEDLQTEKEKLSEELDCKQVCYSFFIWHNQSEALYSYPVLDSDTSSAWNFCARFSDVSSHGNR